VIGYMYRVIVNANTAEACEAPLTVFASDYNLITTGCAPVFSDT
jgi:hypothetical protein